jgi:hypothetical protein
MVNMPFPIRALLDFDQFLPMLDGIDPMNSVSGECILLPLAQEMGYVT